MTLYRWIVMAAVVLGLAMPAAAQTDSGRLSGTVRDASGLFLKGAKVTARNEKTGEVRTGESSAEGVFVIPALKPSMYTVKVEYTGLAPIEYTEMPLAVGQELALDFELKIAGQVETVTVIGTAPVLELSSAKIGVNVTEREVQNLPVNGRQMSQLMLQAPGSQNAGTGTWGDIRFSGRAVEQNVIKYDGVEASGVISQAGVTNGENASLFKLQASLENVQEFRVESSGYPAEFGTGTGGQVSVITKSGGNRFSGSLFEYLRNDAMDSANYFDSQRNPDGSVIAAAGSASTVPQSPLKLNQFGFSTGGPIAKDKLFFFASYEGYRLNAGRNLIQAVPSAAAWATAVPAIAPLRPAFASPGAVILPGATTDPLQDILQWQGTQQVHENAFGIRLDYKMNDKWNSYFRVFRDQAESWDPQDVSGRRFHTTVKPTNVVYNLQGVFNNGTINEFKVGFNGANSTQDATDVSPLVDGILLNLSGTVANAGIAGQGGSTGRAVPGSLLRVNSAGNGRGAPYWPYSLTFADSVSKVMGGHFVKMGADVRMIRMRTDQLGGITYTYTSTANFMANSPSSIQYFGDLSEPSAFNGGAVGDKHIEQQFYVLYAQDEWRLNNLTLNYGLRYDYYSPMQEADDRIVKFNIDTGRIDPNTTPFYSSRKNNFQPRLSATYSLSPRTVVKAGFGIFVGPGQPEDQIQPIESDRINTTATSGAIITGGYPVNVDALRANFTNNPNTRSFQPRAYANEYTLPEKVYQYTASLQRELGWKTAASVAYVGSQGRDLFLRSIANRTVGVQTQGGTTAALQVREFDILTCSNGTVLNGTETPLTSNLCGAGNTISSIQRPFAEIDSKTTGGDDSYNSMQLALTRRSAGVSMNVQYTLGSSKGTTGGSNEAVTAGNNARAVSDWEYDRGYNNFDVRHTFNASALYAIPGSGLLKGGWSVAGIAQARSGLPVEVLVTRNDLIYRDDATGLFYSSAAAGRTALVNTPGGGSSRSKRRPDLVPGVDPFVTDGGLVYLNPAAFAMPMPGTFGNLKRNSIHGPNFFQIDTVVAKRFNFGGKSAEFRLEVFNLFNRANLAGVVGGLPIGLPATTGATPEANTVQPGQSFAATTSGMGTWGRATQTVGTTVGIGTARQIQLGFRLNF